MEDYYLLCIVKFILHMILRVNAMKNPRFYLVILVISCSLIGFGINSYLNSPEEETTAAESLKQPDNKKANADSPFAETQQSDSVSKKAVAKKSSENYNYIQDRLDLMHERRPNATYDAKEVAAAVARTDAWSPRKDVPKNLPLKKEELEDGRELINFDSLKIDTLVPGETLKLAIKETGQQYDVNIDDVEVVDATRTMWRGHIEGTDGQNYQVSLTRGETLTVGGIDTPDGQYIVQAHGNDGWVASSRLLFKNHVDPINPADVIAAEGHNDDDNHQHAN